MTEDKKSRGGGADAGGGPGKDAPDRRNPPKSAPGSPRPDAAAASVDMPGALDAGTGTGTGIAVGKAGGVEGKTAKKLRELGLAPIKARGQHLLVDPLFCAKAASLVLAQAPPAPDGPTVLEIGPGLGAITRPLLDAGARVAAVEVDRGFAAELNRWPEAAAGRLLVFEQSILDFDLAVLPRTPDLVCGNLPYNLSTPILFWFMERMSAVPAGVFMLQREMARRLAARPGTDDYGRLTVAVSLWCEVLTLMKVPRQVFKPVPKVLSGLVCLRLKPPAPAPETRAALGRLTRAAFLARRKTIFNNLSARYGRERTVEVLEALGIDPGVRAETLSPKQFLSLAGALEQ
ncbi:MAG: 16S rRNA (adenine(1518)-N(6)/adenine(1519)-N(6))-dimethyltransferase RsmA [Deltaproteobacteria bacterium]|nr:16S rRNA (adenine(1518)-N(6)/adenine(1519)-N(6))-dimethyltransferase RsmA [Deltaproteobacteria bacterium]